MTEKVKPKCDGLGCGNEAVVERKTDWGTMHYCRPCDTYRNACIADDEREADE